MTLHVVFPLPPADMPTKLTELREHNRTHVRTYGWHLPLEKELPSLAWMNQEVREGVRAMLKVDRCVEESQAFRERGR
jgi:hypothetical protein